MKFLNKELEEIYLKASNGNKEALSFLIAWNIYISKIDDLIDGDLKGTEEILKLFIGSAEMFSSNFYVAHRQILLPVIYLIANDYADSEKMKTAPELWKQQVADHLRFCGNTMIRIVSCICNNYQTMREISEPLWEGSFAEHHDKDGKPI